MLFGVHDKVMGGHSGMPKMPVGMVPLAAGRRCGGDEPSVGHGGVE